jgi:hypothetical protein
MNQVSSSVVAEVEGEGGRREQLQPTLIDSTADPPPSASQAHVPLSNERLPPAPNAILILAQLSRALVPVALGELEFF